MVERGNRLVIRPPFNKARGIHKSAPTDETHAESFYYTKQMQARTPMVIVLKDGEQLHGFIEWYDKTCLKVNRDGAPNVLVYKHNIKYMYKAN